MPSKSEKLEQLQAKLKFETLIRATRENTHVPDTALNRADEWCDLYWEHTNRSPEEWGNVLDTFYKLCTGQEGTQNASR